MLAAFRIGAGRERFSFDDEMNQPIIKDVRRLARSHADNSSNEPRHVDLERVLLNLGGARRSQ